MIVDKAIGNAAKKRLWTGSLIMRGQIWGNII
jgi:hypothetical protein